MRVLRNMVIVAFAFVKTFFSTMNWPSALRRLASAIAFLSLAITEQFYLLS